MVVTNRIERLEWRKTEDGAKGKNPPVMHETPPFIGDEQAKASRADMKAQKFMQRQRAIQARREAGAGTD